MDRSPLLRQQTPILSAPRHHLAVITGLKHTAPSLSLRTTASLARPMLSGALRVKARRPLLSRHTSRAAAVRRLTWMTTALLIVVHRLTDRLIACPSITARPIVCPNMARPTACPNPMARPIASPSPHLRHTESTSGCPSGPLRSTAT